MATEIVIIVISYLIGAIPFGLIIARLAGIADIRKLGSGNIGATNVWRIAGAKVAIWVFVADIGKGVVTVLLAGWAYSNYVDTLMSKELLLALCGIAAVIGHVFPVYLNFRGGKGVNTALGVVATLLPLQALISLVAFVLTVLLFRYISLGSIIAATVLCATILIQKFGLHLDISTTYLIMVIVISFLVILAHRKNIVRILAGTENRFNFFGNAIKTK
ncbi:MAG: glycerol-3-phosphate 1-O-acyltransferase PlsY [Candidatus Zixiibacteriota bacterium]